MKVLPLLILFFSSLFVGENTVSNGYQPGDKATDFKLKSVDGKMYSMADYKDAVLSNKTKASRVSFTV